MDAQKTGALIRALRTAQHLTQKQLADRLFLSDKTVSKWERGLGCPDIALLTDLASALGIGVEQLLGGALPPSAEQGGNMKQTTYFVCPHCGSISLSTGAATLTCCGRPLPALTPRKAEGSARLTVETVEDEWYVTSDHPMHKENYIPFVAFATGAQLLLLRQYPEWELQVRLPKRGHGMLLWHTKEDGLLYQLL